MKKYLIILLSIALVLGALIIGGSAFIMSKLDKLSYTDKTASTETPVLDELVPTEEMRSDLEFTLPTEETVSDKNVLNILLLGTDLKLAGTEDPGRADATMLCSINKATGEIKLISFERGIYVPIPAESNPYGATSDLLTHAYHWGGAELSCKVISECFNLELDGFVQVNLDAFIDIIDAIGGIDLKLSTAEANAINTGRYKLYVETPLVEGTNHLNGHEAAGFARLRKIDNDWNRTGRQRKVISAALNKIKTLKISELNDLVNIILPKVNTNLSKTTLASLLLAAPKILANFSVQQLMVPDENMNEYGYIDCNFKYESLKIANFLYGSNYPLADPGYGNR